MKTEVRLLKQEDLNGVLNYLDRNHMETTFLAGNVKDFGLINDVEKRRCADYYGYFEDKELKGILPVYNLGSCIPHFESEGAIPYFVDIMKERDFEVLLGMSNIVTPLYELLKEHKLTEGYSDDSYYLNENFTPYMAEGVTVVDINSIEKNKAIEFLVETRNEGFGENCTFEDAKKIIEGTLPEEDRVFIVKNDQIVAHAVIQTATNKIGQIGGVFTSAEHRGKGYCKAAVSELCERIIKKGKIPTLMVRKNNTPAVKAYSALGFRYYTDYLIITFK